MAAPLAWCNALVARLDRARSERSGRRERLPCPVVSVGSLAAGGVGGTLAAAWLANGLQARGHRMALLTCGTGRRRGDGVALVSDGRFVRASVAEAGDRALLLAAHAPGVPVLAGRNRVRAGRRALATFGAEIVVLDDGFQHHRLARDVELVLVDGAAGFGNRRCRPAGPLREPPSALCAADALGVVDGPLPPEEELLVAAHAPHARRFAARRAPLAVQPLGGGERVVPELLRGRRVGMLSGIAEPANLRRTLAALGATVVNERCFAAPHVFAAADVAGLAADASLWVTTEKDALKLPAAWVKPAEVWVLQVGFEVEDGAGLLDWIEAKLR